jgi:hypothetical protein
MRLLRKIHATVGIISTLNVLLLIATGFLIQNREELGLDDHYVSRRFLPSGYRPHDDPAEVRSDIVLTDLHSGRVLGRPGVLLVDGLTIAWVALAITGVFLYGAKYVRGGNGRAE